MSESKTQKETALIVIFGASGDLTRRKLVPALHSLSCEGQLAPQTAVIGVARSPMTDESFRGHLYGGVHEYSRLEPGRKDLCALWPDFAGRIGFLAGAYDREETYRRLDQKLNDWAARSGGRDNCIFYLAIKGLILRNRNIAPDIRAGLCVELFLFLVDIFMKYNPATVNGIHGRSSLCGQYLGIKSQNGYGQQFLHRYTPYVKVQE